MEEEIVKVSSKGQVVLPADVRNQLKIRKGQRMVLTIHKGVILMKPVKKLSEMHGILKGVKFDTDKAIEKLRKEWDMELGQ
ncbi:MAG: AbrB/MazE/SpoVT family DNA-binding domain-containing protein [Candidatus Aenigmarchaeota archaeon]|nr:AbrB/MazE/SpoVT family DNA-binding domain-containing protein [Candidatus Aenigmarchaeota archaeon]